MPSPTLKWDCEKARSPLPLRSTPPFLLPCVFFFLLPLQVLWRPSRLACLYQLAPACRPTNQYHDSCQLKLVGLPSSFQLLTIYFLTYLSPIKVGSNPAFKRDCPSARSLSFLFVLLFIRRSSQTP